MVDISSELTYLMTGNVPSFLAFLILKGEHNESVSKSNDAKSISYTKNKSLLSTTNK